MHLLLASGWGLTVIPGLPCLSSLPGGISPEAKERKSPGKASLSLPAEFASQLVSNANGADVCFEADTCL